MREAVRRHRFAFVFIGVVVAVLFLPALVKHEVFTVRDHTDYFQPLRYFTAIHLRDFVLPYWNPYSASGEPWLANPQTGVFYPPTWLFIHLPFETAYMLYLAVHLLVLGWGAYLLFARVVSEGAALVGAVAITFCGPTLSLLDVSNNLASFAWIPLVMWAALARASPKAVAVILALTFLGGEPFFAAIAAMLYVVLRVMPAAADGAVRPPRFFAHARNDILVAGSGAFGLSAMQLFPFLEFVRASDRAARLSGHEIFRESMAPRDWLSIAVPPRLNADGFDAALSQHFIPIIYVGAAVVLLALVAWIFVRRKAVLAWTALLLASIVIASGSHLPFGRIFELVPLTLFRYPSRVVPFGALAIVGLAVLAWDRFRPRARWADLVLVLVLLVDLVPRAAPLLRTAPFRAEVAPYPAVAGRLSKLVRLHKSEITDRKAWIAGYVNLYQRRFDSSTAAPIVSARYAKLHDAALTGWRMDLLTFLGAGFVLSDRPVASPFERIAEFEGVTMYVNRFAPPMAVLWTWWRPAQTADEALDMLIAGGMAAGVPVAGSEAAKSDAAARRQIGVESLTIDTRSAMAVVNAPEDGVLVLTQQDAPGWRVYVDGREEKKLLAGGIFRAVAVPRGRHEVIWRWNPSSLRLGAMLTVITALSLQTSAFVKRFGRRKFSS